MDPSYLESEDLDYALLLGFSAIFSKYHSDNGIHTMRCISDLKFEVVNEGALFATLKIVF